MRLVDLRPDHNQLIGIAELHGRKQGAIDDAEDRGIRSNAKGQNRNSYDSERRLLCQQAKPESNVAEKIAQGIRLRPVFGR